MNNELKEKYILVGVNSKTDTADPLAELEALLDTAGGESVYKIIQHLDSPDPATYVGRGKAEEIRELVHLYEATGILCDDELSPAQIRNLSDILEAKVIDRTILILDIFAAHASTNEGKIQVEMAQQKYRLSHLHGLGKALSRQGGGIGTRGPGETRLESDRRRIQKRISVLSRQISQMKQVRETNRKKRQNEGIPVIAVIGYTNAGKSTMLNKLTGAGVLAEDKLFATLDPTTRMYRLPSGQNILLTDTVGFIDKLPHNLIDAFRSTLEEVRYADILLHVVDISDSNADLHMNTVYETLRELDADNKPVITLFNKIDKLEGAESENVGYVKDSRAGRTIPVSARSGEGLDRVALAITDVLKETQALANLIFPYSKTGLLEVLKRTGNVISEEFKEEGIFVSAYLSTADLGRYSEYITVTAYP
ncbi:MAG: GTPase HflX [Lachnospiraceae bacterium]|nr:GTPase HflX [Lachnospiraceae bacterium]